MLSGILENANANFIIAGDFAFSTSTPDFETSDAIARGTLLAKSGQFLPTAKSTSGL